MKSLHTITRWMRAHVALVAAGAFAVAGIAVGGGLSIASAAAAPAGSGALPTYPADQVPADAPTSGETLPFVVTPDASGESAWGPARTNPNTGGGGLTFSAAGNSVVMSFTGNCGANAYISSTGNARYVVSGNASGMWSTGTLCLPSSRTNSMSAPLSNASCHSDSTATLTVTGTPFNDGSYTVAIAGTNRPCPGEWQNWDWTTNSLRNDSPSSQAPAVTPAPPPSANDPVYVPVAPAEPVASPVTPTAGDPSASPTPTP